MRLPDGRVRKLRRSSDDTTVAHALTFSCFRRQPFLAREQTCLWLVDALERARTQHTFDLWAYVFMPNHVHLVLWPRTDTFCLQSVLAAIKLPVARRAVAWVTREAPAFLPHMLDAQPNGDTAYRFWQRGGGYDRDLREPGTIHATIDYLHANPVRAGLVERPELWRWSSAAHFAGTSRPPLVPDVDSIPAPPPHWRFWSCSG
jgi:putative transposase